MKFRNKFLSLLLAVLIFGSLGAVAPVYAVEAESILATSDIYTRQDEDFTTTLYITEGADICDFQVSLDYNTDLVTLVSAKSLAGSSVVINTATAGLIHVTYSSGSNVTAKTDIVELTFHVDENAGIGVYDCLTVNTKYNRQASHLNETTGAFEDVELTAEFASLVLYEMGDVNLDQSVSVRDVSLLKRHLTYLPTTPVLTEFHLRIADAERDDKVNMRDVARIMRRCAYYLDDVYGDRVNIYFYDVDGNQYAVKSVVCGGDLTKLPSVPVRENYDDGRWSVNPDTYVEPDLTGIEKELKLYAVYGEYQSEAIAYYKNKLTETYYSGDLPTGLSGNLNLTSTLEYQNGYYAQITWQSSSNYVLNSTTGVFTKPTYPAKLTLTAKITSYDANNSIEAQDSIDFLYQVPGMFSTPTKAEIENWLKTFFYNKDSAGYLVNYNLKLPLKLTDEYFVSSTTENFEVRINWTYLDSDGNEQPIAEIVRKTTSQDLDLIATVTFNGEPIEGDGKIYMDGVHVTAISQMEIKNHIVQQVANNVSPLLTDGTELWCTDDVYSTTIQWDSGQKDIATIGENIVSVNNTAIDGSLVPLKAVVSYWGEDENGVEGQQEFAISYTAKVSTENTLIEPGPNMDENLYIALKAALNECNGFTGNLTTKALKAQEFVSLDLSEYADQITSLNGLAYCTNLRALNISGIKLVDESINQIASLPKLQALIAKDCGLDNLSDGGAAVLKNSIYLELLDLSGNNFTSLSSVLDEDVTYGHLQELYLADNKLEDISDLQRAPGLSILSLANNGLTTEDIQQLEAFTYLNYLSLADNQIDNIDVLVNLTNLVELRLQNNQITDISPLRKMAGLHALYLSNNGIKTGVNQLRTLTKLEVLYLNDNSITDISSLDTLTKLKAINVSNNPSLNDLSVLSNCKDTIQEIYAENNSLTSFNFVEGMSNLRILMLSGNAPEDATSSTFLTGQLSGLSNMEVLTLSGKPLLDLNFLDNMPELARLDIANCGLSAYASDDTCNITSIVNRYGTLKVLDISNNDFDGNQTELLTLRNLSNLVIFYADNVCTGLDIYSLVNEMPQLRYISMENCGVEDLSWMSKKHNLVFVDLAGSSISSVDLESQISEDALATLEYLYLDTNAEANFADFYDAGIDNVLKELSLEGVSIDSIKYLPDMDHLTYLNLAETGLSGLEGNDPDFYDVYTVKRYKNLRTLDLNGLDLDLAPVLGLPNLKTIYAVNEPSSMMFYKGNLHTLQSLYNSSVTGYLYDDATVYAPVAQNEGTAILNLIKDFSCDITVAADFIISDNNPVLPEVINDYKIDWSISNETNYEIVDNQLAVKDYANIDDETLTLTAAIQPYDDQEIVTRDFTIDVSILRVSSENREKYYLMDTTGFGNEMQRGDSFSYDVTLQAAETDGFAQPVKPVVEEIVYSYSSVLASGGTTPYPNVLEEQGEHSYEILQSAPLDSTTTITVKFIHSVNGQSVVDDAVDVQFTVKARTYTITYTGNGGTISDSNGTIITSQKKSEDSVLFKDITVKRNGYLFDGWYSDSELTQLYWNEDSEDKTMPAADLHVYAKWIAHSFTLYFDANGGGVSEASRVVLCDQPFGELPTPTRDGYTFLGWFTSDGTEVTSSSTMATAEDVTVYAKWSVNLYTVSWNTGTGYSIAVQRTASPNGGANTGSLSSGDTIYYGDELSVTYTASTGYSLDSTGSTTVIVTGDVDDSTIYASASPNSYTYNIVCRSSNGTNLRSSTVTYKFGTTNTITPPAISGYTTPSTQSVTWDSTSAKTITFTYVPATVSSTSKSGYITNDTYYKLAYSTVIEHRNRTASSVQLRVTWTATLSGSGVYNAYAQWFRASVGSVSTGNVRVLAQGSWSSASSSPRSATASSGWITVPVSTTNATNVSLGVYYYQANYNGTDMSSSGVSNLSATWSIPVPAY